MRCLIADARGGHASLLYMLPSSRKRLRLWMQTVFLLDACSEHSCFSSYTYNSHDDCYTIYVCDHPRAARGKHGDSAKPLAKQCGTVAASKAHACFRFSASAKRRQAAGPVGSATRTGCYGVRASSGGGITQRHRRRACTQRSIKGRPLLAAPSPPRWSTLGTLGTNRARPLSPA